MGNRTQARPGKAARAGAAAMAALLLLLSSCGRSEKAEGPANSAAANAAAAAPRAERAAVKSGGVLNAQAADADETDSPASAEEPAEKRGSTRQAACRIDDEPEQECAFTPLFGDGSFDIDMPDRQLRLIVDGDEAAAFEVIGARRIPLPGLMRRDSKDRACWVAQDQELGLQRVCAR